MNKRKLPVLLLVLVYGMTGYSQINYFLKVEAGYLNYKHKTIMIDPGPNWQGYNLDEENGINLNVINGIHLKRKLYAGLGIGYLNFEGINGLSFFSDLEYVPLKRRLSPLMNLKIGYSHIWNQYKNGTGKALGEFNVGLNYHVNERTGICIKSGFMLTQQSMFLVFRMGFRKRE